MLAYILIGVVVLVLLLLVIVALQPADFRITRSAAFAAPPSTVFEQVNDLHKWEAWSPWVKLDPAARNSYYGPPAGLGAAFSWSGNNKVGAGRMTITNSRPHEQILLKLEFEKPFKGTHFAEFTFKPEGDRTTVTWTMSGRNNFIGKFFGFIMNCDKFIGGQFEQGLAEMRLIVESAVPK